jgi:hypothetical protein
MSSRVRGTGRRPTRVARTSRWISPWARASVRISTPNPHPYAEIGWAGWGGGPGWWGGPYWGNDIDVRQVREGTLSIDVFDAGSHRPVWHGWAKKELTRTDIEQSEQPIRKAVAAILEKFPPH